MSGKGWRPSKRDPSSTTITEVGGLLLPKAMVPVGWPSLAVVP
jgi:hypothetical protein